MPPRAAQTLLFRCVEGHSAEACAALYGIGLPQWQVLFLDAARALTGETQALPDAERTRRAHLLFAAFEGNGAEDPLAPALRALAAQKDDVRALLLAAEQAAAASPARARETWLRRAAVVAIIAISLFVWWRDRDKPPPSADPRTRQLPLPRQGLR